MSLEMKPRCQICGLALPPDGAAFICSYECTYCPACAAATPRCPNCHGELAPRPRRHQAASPGARDDAEVLATIEGLDSPAAG